MSGFPEGFVRHCLEKMTNGYSIIVLLLFSRLFNE